MPGHPKKPPRPARLKASKPPNAPSPAESSRQIRASEPAEFDDDAEVTIPNLQSLRAKPESLRPGGRRLSTLGYEDVPLDPGSRTETPEEAADEPIVDYEGPTVEITDSAPAPRLGEAAPEITVHQSAVGRETLEVITRALLQEVRSSTPELTIAEAPVGRATMNAIEEELLRGAGAESPEIIKPPEPLEIHEMVTFVLRGADAGQLASEGARRDFVQARLLCRLPVSSMAEVDQIDVTPWTVRGTLIVRVWCRIPAS